MSTLTISQISAAVDAAFATAKATWDAHSANASKPALARSSQQIADNATLRVDLYAGPRGAGFIVTAVVKLPWRTMTISRQNGAETHREQSTPTLDALAKECQAARAKRYEAEASVYDQIKTELPKPE